MRGDINDYRVAILYEKGPEAPGSWHPRGYTRAQLKDKLIQIWFSVEELGVSYVMPLLINPERVGSDILYRRTLGTNAGETPCLAGKRISQMGP